MKRKSRILQLMMVLAVGLQAYPVVAADKPPATPKPTAGTLSPALAATPAAAMFGLKEKKIFLIDVRPAFKFAQYRIAGALNIPLHAIKSKLYLKSKPIVLVNEGFVVGPLAQTCRTLNQAGFKAAILAGGLMAWKHKGGKLIGDPFAQNQMNRITPRIFNQEKSSGSLLIIDASSPKNTPDKLPVPGARQLSLLENDKGVQALKKIIKAESPDPFARLVIFTLAGKENHRIQRRLAQAGIYDVFFLEGGLQAYEKHLQYLQLARRPAAQRKVTQGGCNTCALNN